MQACLELDESSVIANRSLRGSWMHHDERIDWAVQHNSGRSSQTLARSTENPSAQLRTFLRVIELDTLVVHYRDRDGTQRRADIQELGKALRELDVKRLGAFRGLPTLERE